MAGRYLQVAIPLPVTGTFTYTAPDELADRAVVGSRVLVPFGRRKLTGFVVGSEEHPPVDGVKDIIDVLDSEPVLSPKMIELARWISEYYLASLGEVLRAALPPGINMESRRFVRVTPAGRRAALSAGSGLSECRLKLLRAAESRERTSVARLVREAAAGKGGRSDLDALARDGLVEIFEEVRPPRAEKGREAIVELIVSADDARSEADSMERKAPRQASALRLLAEAGGTLPMAVLSNEGVASGVVTALADKGLVARGERESSRLSVGMEGWGMSEEGPLTKEQRRAVDMIGAHVERREFGVVLLHGVTGSGKTRVYSETVNTALSLGRGAIVLVPEISLTPQMVQRMKKDFEDRVAVVHSGLSLGQRYDTWRAVKSGAFPVVVGPRSAVFAPVKDLGVIVVDESHGQTYKQGESPRYHARDVAIMRAKLEDAVVILGTATPSLESYINAKEGKYDLIELPDRIDAGPLPDVEIVDMRDEPPVDSEGAFSARLRDAVAETLDAGKQVILFLNRRGFASFVQCMDCGHSATCEHCNVSLTYHSPDRSLRCHYCGHSRPAPAACPECGSANLRFGAPGTQRVELAAHELFPEARLARMDVDTTSRRGSHWKILRAFAERETDILLGTQMIAKGLDFPGVGLVGVVAADVGLNLPDFRSGERTFQLLTQVAGRTGRGFERGRVLVQTYVPDHYTIELARAQRFGPFFDREVAEREGVGLGYPPFTRLVSIVLRGRDERQVSKAAGRLADFLDRGASHMEEPRPEVLGPAPAPIERIKGVYRWQVLVRGRGGTARALVAGALAQRAVLGLPSAVAVAVDVDPLDLL